MPDCQIKDYSSSQIWQFILEIPKLRDYSRNSSLSILFSSVRSIPTRIGSPPHASTDITVPRTNQQLKRDRIQRKTVAEHTRLDARTHAHQRPLSEEEPKISALMAISWGPKYACVRACAQAFGTSQQQQQHRGTEAAAAAATLIFKRKKELLLLSCCCCRFFI